MRDEKTRAMVLLVKGYIVAEEGNEWCGVVMREKASCDGR